MPNLAHDRFDFTISVDEENNVIVVARIGQCTISGTIDTWEKVGFGVSAVIQRARTVEKTIKPNTSQ